MTTSKMTPKFKITDRVIISVNHRNPQPSVIVEVEQQTIAPFAYTVQCDDGMTRIGYGGEVQPE